MKMSTIPKHLKVEIFIVILWCLNVPRLKLIDVHMVCDTLV